MGQIPFGQSGADRERMLLLICSKRDLSFWTEGLHEAGVTTCCPVVCSRSVPMTFHVVEQQVACCSVLCLQEQGPTTQAWHGALPPNT